MPFEQTPHCYLPNVIHEVSLVLIGLLAFAVIRKTKFVVVLSLTVAITLFPSSVFSITPGVLTTAYLLLEWAIGRLIV